MVRAAIGLRAHSGWAAMIAVAGTGQSVTVIDRRRIELISPGIPAQPYHAAEPLELPQAEQLVHRSIEEARRLAAHALRAITGDLVTQDHQIIACGILRSSARPAPALASILASHALIHGAEGDLFRDAIAHAAAGFGLVIRSIREREVFQEAEAATGIRLEELQRRLAEMGRSMGPPWRQDEKLAALAAWIALAAA